MCAKPAPATGASLRRRAPRPMGGFTLIEALLATVVMGVGLTGVLLAFNTVVRHSADPVLRKQMAGMAQELLEEIMLKPYAPAANAAATGCARETFNDILDYHGYSSTGFCTAEGVPILALSSFSISSSVVAGTLAGVGAAKQIAVTVSQGSESVTLKTWRTDYASP